MNCDTQTINIPVQLEECTSGLHILGSEVEKEYVCRVEELLDIISKLYREKDELTFINKCHESEIQVLLNKNKELELKNNKQVQTFTKPLEENNEKYNIF